MMMIKMTERAVVYSLTKYGELKHAGFRWGDELVVYENTVVMKEMVREHGPNQCLAWAVTESK